MVPISYERTPLLQVKRYIDDALEWFIQPLAEAKVNPRLTPEAQRLADERLRSVRDKASHAAIILREAVALIDRIEAARQGGRS